MPNPFVGRTQRFSAAGLKLFQASLLLFVTAAPSAPPERLPSWGADSLLAEPRLAGDSVEILFGAFPYQEPVQLEAVLAPLTRYMAQRLGVPVRFTTNSTFERFRSSLVDGKFDLALVQPFDYVGLPENSPYAPVARLLAPLTAIFVVRDDSSVLTLEDLRGDTIVFPPVGAAVSYLGAAMLEEHGLVSNSGVVFRHVRNHQSCLHHVLAGLARVCVTNSIPFRDFQSMVQVPLRVIDETTEIPHILFVIHRRVKADVRLKLTRLLLDGESDPGGRRALSDAGFGPLTAAVDEDYETVRAMWRARSDG